MGSKGRMPPPHMRHPHQGPGMVHPDPYGHGGHPSSGNFLPYDMLPPPEVMEQKFATQHVEMQRLMTENQRLLATHGTLRQELAGAQHELEMLHVRTEAMKSEGEQQMRNLMDKIAKMEPELQAAESMKLELQQARAEAQNLVVVTQELQIQRQQLGQELQRVHSEVQQVPALKSELDGLMQEFQHCRATYDYEKKLYSDHVESLKLMENNYLNMSLELEKLRASLANSTNAERRPSGPYGGYSENEASGHHSVGQNAYEDGYGVPQGHAPLPGGGGSGGAPPAGIPAYPVPQSGAPPAYAGYEAQRAPAYDAQRAPAYDSQRGGVGGGYDSQRGVGGGYDTQRGVSGGYDAQRGVGGGYDAQRGVSSGYDTQRGGGGGYGYDLPRGGQGYDAPRGGSSSSSSLLVTKEEGLEVFEDMILGRAFEDMCAQMYYRGKMFGFVHLYNGQEAVSSGFIKLLKKEDSVVSTYRDHVHSLSKGVPARQVMSELFGKATGVVRGQGGSMHMFSKEYNVLGGFAFIGEGIPVATGAAFTSKYKREVLKQADCDHVTLAFFGDGTCNNGQFFECLNMAALWKLPIVFVVENNLWAIGMSHLRSTSDPEIWKKGPAFGMPGVHVDGMDVLKVREVAKEAIGRARRGEGPTLVECETYRFRGHSLADPDELRDPAEKAHYAARDPITALKKYMLENKLASEADFKAIEKKIDEVVEDAVEFADASPHPERSQLLENVFADPKGFGIGPDGKYRCEDPKFTQGTAHV